jgi:hypothetical protein
MTSDRVDDSSPPESGEDKGEKKDLLPFPDSLCHRCAAPPQYIHSPRSTFIRCPILKRYPPQPVRACEAFVPADGTEDPQRSV